MKALLAIAVFSTGCLSIEAEIEETCVSRHDVEIEGVDARTSSHAFLVEDMSDVHRLLEYDAELEFVRADIRPTSGVTSLAFVESAAVSVENTPVYACDGNCPSNDGVEMLATSRQSATPFLSADALAVQLTVTGQLPTSAWTVDIDVCVRGKASYTLSP